MHDLMVFGVGLLCVLGFIIIPALPATIYGWMRWWWSGKVYAKPNEESTWFVFNWLIGLFLALGVFIIYGIGEIGYFLIRHMLGLPLT